MLDGAQRVCHLALQLATLLSSVTYTEVSSRSDRDGNDRRMHSSRRKRKGNGAGDSGGAAFFISATCFVCCHGYIVAGLAHWDQLG